MNLRSPRQLISRMNLPDMKKLKEKQLFITSSIIGAALLMSASIFATGPKAAPIIAAEKAWPVSVVYAQPQEMKPAFQAFGKLESNRVANLRSDLVLRIDMVLVREGDWVNEGDLLVQLDAREMKLKLLEREAELKQAQANLASTQSRLGLEQRNAKHFQSRYAVARAKLKRHEDLMAQRLIAKSLLDEVTSQANEASIELLSHQQNLSNLPNEVAVHEATVAKAQALREQAELDLAKTEIRAPFNGPVLGVFAAPGDHTSLSAPLVEMADADSFEVRVQVPDTYAEVFRTHPEGAIFAATPGGARLDLSRLSSHVRAGQTGTDAFFGYTREEDPTLMLGQILDLIIQLPPQPGLVALPVQSIYDSERIFKVVEDRLVGIPVRRVGEYESEDAGFRLLISTDEIAAGEPIITTQLPRAIDGLLVAIANES